MSNTVINIYGDLNINIHQRVELNGDNLNDIISSSVIKMIENRSGEQIEDKYEETRESTYHTPRSKVETPCYDYYGRWSNEAQRDAWRRFYRANGV